MAQLLPGPPPGLPPAFEIVAPGAEPPAPGQALSTRTTRPDVTFASRLTLKGCPGGLSMNAAVLRRRPREPILHPRSCEAWFRAQSPERQEELHEACRARAARDEELARAECRAFLRSALETAVVFALLDGFCPGAAWGTAAGALVLGAGLGTIFAVRDAGRLSSGVIGMLAFLLFQLATRGGLSAAHLFFLFPAGGICALLGLRREEAGIGAD